MIKLILLIAIAFMSCGPNDPPGDEDMGELIKELRTSFILDSIDVRFDGITVKGEDRILSLTLSRKS